MERVNYNEIRTGQYVMVQQLISRAPGHDRLGVVQWWGGKVTERNAKWLKAKNDGKEFIIAQQGIEHYFVLEKKEFATFLKNFSLEDMVVDYEQDD